MPIYTPGKVVLRQQYVPLDANYPNVSLLLHGDGPNGSTIITDNSPTPKTVTAVGNAQISTAQSKFGGASIAFDGSGDFLTIPANADFNIGSSDYTVELWMYINQNPGLEFGSLYRRALIGNYGNSTSGWSLQLRGTSTSYTTIALGDGDTEVIVADTTILQNAWHHLALSKSGADCKLFFNGSQVGSTASRSTFFDSGTRTFRVGRIVDLYPGWDFAGFIDDVRITKAARYTANFTPPTAPFPDRTDG